MILGLVWASAPPAALTSAQRLLISAVVGILVFVALYLWLKQSESTQEPGHSDIMPANDRDKVAANISHEIRTPLAGILGVMHLLRRTQLDRNQQRYVDTATNSANMLLAIINDVISYARMDSTGFPVESESLELAEVVEDVSSILAPEALNKGLELVSDIDPNIPQKVTGDPLRLRQVLNNLLINAIKYTDEGVVAIYITSRDGKIEIGVRDTGIGMKPEQRELLLQPISSMDGSYDLQPGAAGLGIKISRRLLRAMGSDLQIESISGQGSRFFFELAADGDHSEAYDWKPPRAMRELSVAILSPYELQRSSILKMLAHWQINAIQEFDYDVESGGELPGLELCDLVIVDQTETEQAVNRFIDRLRNQSEWREAKFVHLVPQNREGDGGSADVRLYKPLSHSRLYAMMMDIVYKQAYSNEYDPAQDAARSQDAAGGALQGRRILLVEDNDINKMIVLEILGDTGVDVDVAINGADAVAQVQQQHYDLILMDIQMPVMDGYESTRQIRSLGGVFATLPIIAMTAHALEGDSGRSLDAGMDNHVTKPFEPEAFIGLIARYIDERGQQA